MAALLPPLLWRLLLLQLCLARPTPTPTPTPMPTPTDGELLLAFKATFINGDSILASWNSTEPCAVVVSLASNWEGVFCNGTGGHVTVV